MPIYEYECASCGKQSEISHKMSDPAPDNCPVCGKGPLSKLMSAAAFHLKGGGWYTDGYSSKSAAKDESTAKSDTSSTDKPAEKKESTPKSTPSSGTDS